MEQIREFLEISKNSEQGLGTSEIWRKQTELEKERMKKKTNTTICQLSNHTSGWGHVHISATSNKAEAYGTSNTRGLSIYDILAA